MVSLVPPPGDVGALLSAEWCTGLRRGPIRVRARCLVVRDGRLLVQATPDGVVEVPGGRVEYGESLPFCVVRELREEAGVNVEPKDLVYVVEFRGEKRGRRRHEVLFYFKCTMEGDPHSKERGLRFVWLTPEDLSRRKFWPKALLPYLTSDMPDFPYVRFLSIRQDSVEFIMSKRASM